MALPFGFSFCKEKLIFPYPLDFARECGQAWCLNTLSAPFLGGSPLVRGWALLLFTISNGQDRLSSLIDVYHGVNLLLILKNGSLALIGVGLASCNEDPPYTPRTLPGPAHT